MKKITKNIVLAAAFVIAGSGCVPAYGGVQFSDKVCNAANKVRAEITEKAKEFAGFKTIKPEPTAWEILSNTCSSIVNWSSAFAGIGTAYLQLRENRKIHAAITLTAGLLPLVATLSGYNYNPAVLPIATLPLSSLCYIFSNGLANPESKAVVQDLGGIAETMETATFWLGGAWRFAKASFGLIKG